MKENRKRNRADANPIAREAYGWSGEELMALMQYVLEHGWIMALVSLMMAALCTCLVWYGEEPLYESVAKLYAVDASDAIVDLSVLQMSNYLTADYQEALKTWEVNEKVIELCELDCTMAELRERVSVRSVGSSRVLYVAVRWTDPFKAAEIANTYCLVVQDYIGRVMSMDRPSVLSMGKPDGKPVSYSVLKCCLVGAGCGLLGAFMVLVLCFFFKDRVRGTAYLRDVAGMQVIAMIPVERRDDR